MDRIDCRLLAHLQTHGRATNLELAQAVRLSPAQCQRRHKRLEERGYVERYEARLNARKLDLGVVAFIDVAMEKGHIRDLSKFTDAIAALPEILERDSVTGDFDCVIKVIAQDLKSLSQFLTDRRMRLAGVNSVRSSICLDEIQCTSALRLPE